VTWLARVSDVRFIGSLVHYLVTMPGRKWQVSARAGSADILAEGTRVSLSWRDEEGDRDETGLSRWGRPGGRLPRQQRLAATPA